MTNKYPDLTYLGHSPKTVADEYYIAVDATRLDEPLRWLGQQLGIRIGDLPSPRHRRRGLFVVRRSDTYIKRRFSWLCSG